MKVLRTVEEVRRYQRDHTIGGFVPTMGALHEGHFSLIRAAAKIPGETAVSIFVNPTQFAPTDDLTKYPRSLEADLRGASAAGATIAFVPSVDEMYKRPHVTVHMGGVALPFEGAMRPGHFDGVGLVVAKLFNIVCPRVAVFGLKDLQQCAVIRLLVDALDLPVELQFEETTRESDGLAMSSRNRYFNAEQRNHATHLPRIMQQCTKLLRENVDSWAEVMQESIQELQDLGFDTQYLAAVNPLTFEMADSNVSDARLIVAARWAGVRLIDNWPVFSA